MFKLLDDKKARKACVSLVKKLLELGVSNEVISEIHCEVGELLKAGIDIGTEQTIQKAFNDVKKNTTAENSDVNDDSYGPKYHRASFLLNQIKKLLEQKY